jgi:hypothetical protein
VLEAINDGMVLSTVLEPMDSTHTRANALINRPCCALVSQRA